MYICYVYMLYIYDKQHCEKSIYSYKKSDNGIKNVTHTNPKKVIRNKPFNIGNLLLCKISSFLKKKLKKEGKIKREDHRKAEKKLRGKNFF